MHSSTFDSDVNGKDGAEVLVGVATLVTEGRIPGKLNSKSKKFFEGPHCTITKRVDDHQCDLNDSLCLKFDNDRDAVLSLWHKNIPLCIEVLLTCMCEENGGSSNLTRDSIDSGFLLEQWHFNINYRRHTEPLYFNLPQLVSAIRSQLYFSQLTAWLTTQDENSIYKISKNNLHYRLSIPGETYETSKFSLTSIKHDFPITDIGNGLTLKVTFLSLPRMSATPTITCSKCASSNNKQTPPEPEDKIQKQQKMDLKNNLVDDRMHTSCTLKGKHRCEDYEELDNVKLDHLYLSSSYKRICHNSKKGLGPEPSTSKPKLMVNIEKANNNQKNEKRNISPNEEQKVKSVKLDYEVPDRLWYKLSPQAGSICRKNDLNKGQLLLDAIERSGQQPQQKPSTNENGSSSIKCESDKMAKCDMSDSDIFSIKQKNNFNIYVDNNYCDSPIPKLKQQQSKKFKDISNNVKPISTTSNLLIQNKVKGARQKLTFGDDDESIEDNNKTKLCDKITTAHQSTTTSINGNSNNNGNNNNNGGKLGKDGVAGVDIPTPMEQAKFRKNLDNAASMVFHSRTGLPLTSSPAPVRRGKSCFDFDSSINSVSAIKSALFSSSFSTDDESESEGSIVSPCSPETYIVPKRDITPVKYRRKGHAANLLGSFEESVLNGRLEPVSTVHGFTAELGASGSFVPKHLVVPVTVFFYTLGDNDKVSSPYLSHINLGKKGYNVPKSGTVQVTLFNPLGTVVKMFVIMYDLSDMPPNSQTFIRQRTLYMPANCKDDNLEWGPKWLRYLIHLRFMSSKSGKIYLHSDIRMIIFRKCDMDTATAHGIDMSYELRSFTHAPTNPRFSPRK